MNKRKIVDDIKQNYLLKRMRAQEECENFVLSLRQNKQFDELYKALNENQLKIIKANLQEEKEQLQMAIENLKRKINEFLKINNIDANKLEPNYDCKICKDTGVFNGKMCECLAKTLNEKISLGLSSYNTFKSFENCDLNIMDDNDVKAFDLIKTWCAKYPHITKTNINIIGGAGSGKTFLLECVANELMNKNVAICFKTAFEINELARLYHCGKSFDFTDCLETDVLLIDDLGTEPVLKNITKEYLYNIINIRQAKGKPTFISTNLDFNNILDRYDERIFSRLGNKNLSINIQLLGKDKRLN